MTRALALLALLGLSSCININPPATADPSTPAPAQASSPTPPAAPTPPEPPARPAASPPTLGFAGVPEFHLQLSVQEHILGAKGLGKTFHYPEPGTDLPVFKDKVGIVYEWRPKDGLEDRINPRTNKPWGPIWKETVVEQLEPDNLQRHLSTVEQWVGTYVPRDFDGVVALDVERWPLRGDEFHMSKKGLEDLAKQPAGTTQAGLMARFMRLTEDRVRAVRPRVRGWGWWSMGTVHPGYLTWHAAKYQAWKTSGLAAEQAAVAGGWIPFPSFYFPTTYPDAGIRRQIWPRLTEHWSLLYGRDRLAKDAYAYLNIRHSGDAGPPYAGKPLTRAEFHECVEAAWSIGIRKFVIWDAIESPAARDTAQKFIDEILTPEARLFAERARAERAPR